LNPRNTDRPTQSQSGEFDPTVLRRLALSESGFVFDPVTGNSFSTNDSGLAVLKLLQSEKDFEAVIGALASRYDVDERTAERDLRDFVVLLDKYFK